MHRRFTFGIVAMSWFLSLVACGDDDTTPTGTAGAAGTGGVAGSAGAAGAAGTATGGAGAGGSAGTGGALGDATIPDAPVDAPSPLFSFFVSSTGSMDGGNLGGLAGADQKCGDLATSVGAGSKPWRAYLSVSGLADAGLDAAPDAGGPVNARDRIGTGPWYNVRGQLIAMTLAALHEEGDAGMNGINAATGLDEHGLPVPTGGDSGPNEHDILTGSMPDGRAFAASPDLTCAGWTSNQAGPPPPVVPDADAADDAGDASDASDAAADAALGPRAFVGHVNRTGTNGPPANASWNSSHPTTGCAQADFVRVGGSGRIYCFAVTP